MATVKPVVRYLKEDNTAKVEIRITHKEKPMYVDTGLYVTKDDLATGKKLKLKASYYDEVVMDYAERIRKYIAALGLQIKTYNTKELKDYIIKQEETKVGANINFIDFCIEENELLKEKKGENGTYKANKTAISWLKKFAQSDYVNVNGITKRYLEDFESFMLKNELGTAGVSCYLRALRTFFIAAMDKYNDEARGIDLIKHYPFRKFRIKEHKAEKRNVEADIVREIINAPTVFAREELGKDMFALTFYLAGIAPIDLYQLKEPVGGYIQYYRDKVKNRENRIKIKIKVDEQANAIITKYSTDGFLSDIKRYASEKEFSAACRKGLEAMINRMNEDRKEPLPKVTLYWARHTFSTIAGMLRYDTNLIDYTLGHSPKDMKMAEIYIERKQETIDELVRDVISKVSEKKQIKRTKNADKKIGVR